MSTSDHLTTLDTYKLLGNSGLRVSPFCLGTMTFGTEWGMGAEFEESKKIFDHFVEKGGNFIDTANIYTNGTSERFIGEMLGQRRSELVIATKYSINSPPSNPDKSTWPSRIYNVHYGGNSRKSLVQNVDESLQRMKIGSIDLLYLHVWDMRTPAEEWIRAMDDVVRSGKVNYVAISDTPSWVISRAQTIAELRGWSPLIALQTRYNLLDRSMETDLSPMARTLGLGIVPWGVIAEGFLTGKHTRATTGDVTVAEGSGRSSRINQHAADEKNWKILDEVKAIATEVNRSPVHVTLNWTMQKKGITSPLLGAKSLTQLKDNLAAMEFKLTQEQIARLDAVSAPPMPFPHSMGSSEWTTGAYNVEKRYVY